MSGYYVKLYYSLPNRRFTIVLGPIYETIFRVINVVGSSDKRCCNAKMLKCLYIEVSYTLQETI